MHGLDVDRLNTGWFDAFDRHEAARLPVMQGQPQDLNITLCNIDCVGAMTHRRRRRGWRR